jgi:hypothetical protein
LGAPFLTYGPAAFSHQYACNPRSACSGRRNGSIFRLRRPRRTSRLPSFWDTSLIRVEDPGAHPRV